MVSFRKFLTESDSLNSKNYSYNKYDSYLNEEFKTDEEGIKQLQNREYEEDSGYFKYNGRQTYSQTDTPEQQRRNRTV